MCKTKKVVAEATFRPGKNQITGTVVIGEPTKKRKKRVHAGNYEEIFNKKNKASSKRPHSMEGVCNFGFTLFESYEGKWYIAQFTQLNRKRCNCMHSNHLPLNITHIPPRSGTFFCRLLCTLPFISGLTVFFIFKR